MKLPLDDKNQSIQSTNTLFLFFSFTIPTVSPTQGKTHPELLATSF